MTCGVPLQVCFLYSDSCMHMLKFSYTTTEHNKIFNVVEYNALWKFGGYCLSFLIIVSGFVHVSLLWAGNCF